jgi:hypothetical protein
MSPEDLQQQIRDRREFEYAVDRLGIRRPGGRVTGDWNATEELYSVFFMGSRILMLDRYSGRWFVRDRRKFKRDLISDAVFDAIPEAEVADSAFMFSLAVAGSLVAAIDYRLTGERYGLPDTNSLTSAEHINYAFSTFDEPAHK